MSLAFPELGLSRIPPGGGIRRAKFPLGVVCFGLERVGLLNLFF